MSRILSRRRFLEAGALGLAGTVLRPEALLADPYGRWPTAERSEAEPIRVRGVVRSAGRGIAGVPVSDGFQVVDTDADGTFDLVTTSDQPFVWFTTPAGYRTPVNPTGTARFYEPLSPGRSEHSVTFDLEPEPIPQEDHTLLLLGDIQTQDAQEMAWFLDRSVPDVKSTVAEVGPDTAFGISCGDIMYDNLELYPDYERGVREIGIPFYQVIGNHDLDMDNLTDEASAETYTRHFGPPNYSFNRGAIHYVVLDDVFWHGSGYIGYLESETLAWLEQDLSRIEPGASVIVATHIPVLGSQYARRGERRPRVGTAINNREALYRLLEPFEAHILTGHTHESEHVFEHGTHEHVTGAVCGAWWSGPICFDGTPNGYCVYDIRGSEVTWRYKATGESADHQMRIYPPGSDPSAQDELVVNVWNWDPEWTVRMYADGQPRGEPSRRLGLDPLSVELHTGDDLPPRRTWVEPVPTDHLFYGRVDGTERVVTIEATDRFGRTFVDEWRPAHEDSA